MDVFGLWKSVRNTSVLNTSLLNKEKQKQPLEVFCKKMFLKIRKFHRTPPVLQTFRPVTLLKRDSDTGVLL